jgi:hypothetical protein
MPALVRRLIFDAVSTTALGGSLPPGLVLGSDPSASQTNEKQAECSDGTHDMAAVFGQN